MQKSSQRYWKIFSRYEDERSLRGCLYVADGSFLKTLLEEAKNFPSIYFTTIAELFEKKEKTVFKNGDGDSLLIEDYLEKKSDNVDLPLKNSLEPPPVNSFCFFLMIFLLGIFGWVKVRI